MGVLAGMAADLDILIRSDVDPLLFLEYHRQFTHSLVFIPIAALMLGTVFYAFVRRQMRYRDTVLIAGIAYATHGLLDACTSYGTLLFWPFSDARIAWNNVSVIDPLFTVPLFVLVVMALLKKQPLWARMGFAWALVYLSLGVWQHERAVARGAELALSRGHTPAAVDAKPSFGNLLLFKTIYEYDDRYYVDAVRVGWQPSVYPGESVAKLNISKDIPWLDPKSQQAQDIERFRWFSAGYLAMDPRGEYRITDIRYSILPNRVRGLWGIELNPNAAADTHAAFISTREVDESKTALFMSMLRGLPDKT
ncbi:membrane-bound metal-dependent hydrolase [Luminiphilus syltensis NOR5-1B]|uniref:Membrane-bound metal-dependent hydrolase n=2 Tax=Luminiphilus TaxID=1341118 RepID=B8KSB6_9GAMM|nr:membrane-bound metal-dependent hydrolase [Luminiphilus syltensis NOR5-1B]